jgi:outer membrane protein OmpA-like peptidoglycan-associated protein
MLTAACTSTGKWPTGYAYHNNTYELWGPETTAMPMTLQAQSAAPATDVMLPNENVTVYPVDEAMGNAAPAPAMPSAPVAQADDTLYMGSEYGRLTQEVFFAHGSAAIGKSDRDTLKMWAKGLNAADAGNMAVTVVGHASARVDGVNDPVRRKMVNFEMAQKRANAVTHALTQAGVNPSWVQAVSKGDEEPNANPGVRSQEEADRRADIYVK